MKLSEGGNVDAPVRAVVPGTGENPTDGKTDPRIERGVFVGRPWQIRFEFQIGRG